MKTMFGRMQLRAEKRTESVSRLSIIMSMALRR
jgi:hypothetical protein